MSLPIVGPGVVLKIEDLVPSDAGIMTATKLVGKLVGDYRKTFDDTAVGVQRQRPGRDTIEVQDVTVAAVSGVITLTTKPLRWNTSTTAANAIGGVYEYTAVVSVAGQTWKNEYSFRFLLDEQAPLAADGNGNVSYDQVASDSDGVLLPSSRLALGQITDVDLDTLAPSDSDALVFDAATGDWVPQDVTAAAEADIATLQADMAAANSAITSNASAVAAAQVDADTNASDLADEIAETAAEQLTQDTNIAAALSEALIAQDAANTNETAIATNATFRGLFESEWTDGEITGTAIDHRTGATVIAPSVLTTDSHFRVKKIGTLAFIDIHLEVTAGGFGGGAFRVYGMDSIGARVGESVPVLTGYANIGGTLFAVHAIWATADALTFYSTTTDTTEELKNMHQTRPATFSSGDQVNVSGFVPFT